nr:zinc finger, CCHC-type [Tanacetum cinerariifolium]
MTPVYSTISLLKSYACNLEQLMKMKGTDCCDFPMLAKEFLRGFIFGPPIALVIGAKFVPLHKPRKLARTQYHQEIDICRPLIFLGDSEDDLKGNNNDEQGVLLPAILLLMQCQMKIWNQTELEVKAMAEEDAFHINNVEGGLRIDYTDARIVGRCNSGSDKNKGKVGDLAQDSDKGKGKEVGGPSVNMTEEGGKNKHHKQNKGKKSDPLRTTVVLVPTGNLSWNVGSVVRLVTSKGIDVAVKRTTQMLMVWEKGLRTNPKTKVDAIAWWIDYGATTHVCKDRCWFKTFEPVEDGSVLYMGGEHFAPVHGKGSVALEFSFGKTVTLFNVLYVPKLRKNLVYGPVLNKCGYKQVYESDKYILSKCGVLVGFGYYNNGMFMLNLNKVPDDSDSVYMSSSSTVVNTSLWHARLGHMHYKRMLEMSKDELIPAIDENSDKCTTSRDAIFNENHIYSIHRPKDIIPNLNESQKDDLSDDVPSEISEPRKGKRVRKAKSYVFDFQLYLVEGSRDQVGSQYSYCYNIEEDPRTYNEAMQSWDAAFWKEPIDDEIRSIMENNTWVLSDLPPGCKP